MDPASLVRGVTPIDDRPRPQQALRRDGQDGGVTGDQGPGPATVDTTPPRTAARARPRLASRAANQSVHETTAPRSDGLTNEQTIDLFQRTLDEARNETQQLAGAGEGAGTIKPTLTIDLGRAKIRRLPDPVMDLIMADVERLSLSHNMLRFLPTRMAECTQLRYLNIRSNEFGEIPPPVYSMPFLEILDVSKNKIKNIQPAIKNLESLRVFSIVFNKLTELPPELAELPRLKVLKVAENPLDKIQKVIREKEQELAFNAMSDNDKDTAMTIEILKHLKRQHHPPPPPPAATPVLDHAESTELPSATEPSRPVRRALSGRFPVVPAALSSDALVETPDTAHAPSKPSLPAKSHLRVASGQSHAGSLPKRPAVAPVVHGNERNRSHSESIVPATAATRQKRMGIVRRERPELDSIDETKVARQSHLRGFSYASALRRNGSISSPGAASSSPGSPRHLRKERSQQYGRLSSLPEHRRDQVRRPLIEGAKGMLYALYQVYPHIHGLIGASKSTDARRSRLEMAFYNAAHHIDGLNKSLEAADTMDPDAAAADDDDAWARHEETINNDCAICIKCFVHVTTQMQEATRHIVAQADPRYVRSLMLLLYGSIVEIHNAITSLGHDVPRHRRQMSSGTTHPIATIPEEPTAETRAPGPSTSRDRDALAMTGKQPARQRSDTVLKHASPSRSWQPVPPPALRLPDGIPGTASTPPTAYARAASSLGPSSSRSGAPRSRSNSQSTTPTVSTDGASVASTPRSIESYPLPPMASLPGRIHHEAGVPDVHEEQRFEQIFLALTKAYETALQALPVTILQLERGREAANEPRQPKSAIDVWTALVHKSRLCYDLSQALQIRLVNMKMKDSGVGLSSAEGGRHDPSFWVLCKSFLSSLVGLLTEMREGRKSRLLVLPQEAVAVLRPVQKACQEAGHAIATSPWNHLLEGVSPMPAPTPLSRGADPPAARPPFNRSATVANSNVASYSSALAHQQTSQSLDPHYPPNSRMPLPPPPSSQSSASTPTAATPTSVPAPSPLPAPSPIPAPPLLAALGPAAQATVPSTPASLYGDSFFRGNVFQRADSLLSMPQAAGLNFLNRN